MPPPSELPPNPVISADQHEALRDVTLSLGGLTLGRYNITLTLAETSGPEQHRHLKEALDMMRAVGAPLIVTAASEPLSSLSRRRRSTPEVPLADMDSNFYTTIVEPIGGIAVPTVCEQHFILADERGGSRSFWTLANIITSNRYYSEELREHAVSASRGVLSGFRAETWGVLVNGLEDNLPAIHYFGKRRLAVCQTLRDKLFKTLADPSTDSLATTYLQQVIGLQSIKDH